MNTNKIDPYKLNVFSNKNNSIEIEIKIIEKNLEIKALLVEKLLTKTYIGNFSLEDLKKNQIIIINLMI